MVFYKEHFILVATTLLILPHLRTKGAVNVPCINEPKKISFCALLYSYYLLYTSTEDPSVFKCPTISRDICSRLEECILCLDSCFPKGLFKFMNLACDHLHTEEDFLLIKKGTKLKDFEVTPRVLYYDNENLITIGRHDLKNASSVMINYDSCAVMNKTVEGNNYTTILCKFLVAQGIKSGHFEITLLNDKRIPYVTKNIYLSVIHRPSINKVFTPLTNNFVLNATMAGANLDSNYSQVYIIIKCLHLPQELTKKCEIINSTWSVCPSFSLIDTCRPLNSSQTLINATISLKVDKDPYYQNVHQVVAKIDMYPKLLKMENYSLFSQDCKFIFIQEGVDFDYFSPHLYTIQVVWNDLKLPCTLLELTRSSLACIIDLGPKCDHKTEVFITIGFENQPLLKSQSLGLITYQKLANLAKQLNTNNIDFIVTALIITCIFNHF